jgi:hypothetical protein
LGWIIGTVPSIQTSQLWMLSLRIHSSWCAGKCQNVIPMAMGICESQYCHSIRRVSSIDQICHQSQLLKLWIYGAAFSTSALKYALKQVFQQSHWDLTSLGFTFSGVRASREERRGEETRWSSNIMYSNRNWMDDIIAIGQRKVDHFPRCLSRQQGSRFATRDGGMSDTTPRRVLVVSS